MIGFLLFLTSSYEKTRNHIMYVISPRAPKTNKYGQNLSSIHSVCFISNAVKKRLVTILLNISNGFIK